MKDGKSKLLIIGLDGATFDIVSSLMEEHRLPNLSSIKENGIFGLLESTIPPHSFPSWSTFLTGVNPGKHGVFFTMKWDRKDYRGHLLSWNDIMMPSFWELTGRRGLKTGVVNFPMCYPPAPLNGFMVTGMLTPSLKSGFTYPPELGREILSRFDYQIEPLHSPNRDKYLEDIFACLRIRRDLTLYLMEKKNWDIFIVIFTELDRIQHYFWDGLEVEHFERLGYDSRRYRAVIPLFYETLDRVVGELIEKAGDGTKILILSDHGFQPCLSIFHVNEFLRQAGFLTTKRFAIRKRVTPYIRSLIKKSPIYGYLQKRFVATRWERGERAHNLFISNVVWEKTRAYCGPDGGIHINMKGRERDGIVEERDAEGVKKEIIDNLESLEDPNLSRRVIKKVYLREDLYRGPFAPFSPDIIFDMNRGFARWDLDVPQDTITGPDPVEKAWHAPQGVLFAKGEGIKKGVELNGARMLDVAPLILYLTGTSIPAYMDGSLYEGVFEEEYIKKNPPLFIKEDARFLKEKFRWESEDEEIIKDRLKGLGYL